MSSSSQGRFKVSRATATACVAILAGGILYWFWSDLCLARADRLLQKRDHEAAAGWIDRALWLKSVDGRTCLLQLRVARRRRDLQEVERKLQQAVDLNVPRGELQRQRWLAMAQANQFNTMQAYWSDLLSDPRDDGPEIARGYYTWCMLHHDLKQAEKTLTLWSQDYPRDPEPLGLAGRYYQSMHNWEGVEDSYRRASELAPTNDEFRLAYANALQIRLKTKEAVAIYQDYLSRHPDDLSAIQGLAQCAASNGDLETAIRILKSALEKKPADYMTQKILGEALLSAGDAPAALELLEKAYRTTPEHANLAYSLARALKACGRSDEAEPLFAFVAESKSKLDQLVHLEKQLRKQPGDLDLRMKIAAVTAKYVSRQDAIRWYQNLLQIAPDYAPAHKQLAELYHLTGNDKLSQFHADRISQSDGASSTAANSPLNLSNASEKPVVADPERSIKP